jgi:hypothetical protein
MLLCGPRQSSDMQGLRKQPDLDEAVGDAVGEICPNPVPLCRFVAEIGRMIVTAVNSTIYRDDGRPHERPPRARPRTG